MIILGFERDTQWPEIQLAIDERSYISLALVLRAGRWHETVGCGTLRAQFRPGTHGPWMRSIVLFPDELFEVSWKTSSPLSEYPIIRHDVKKQEASRPNEWRSQSCTCQKAWGALNF
jgi:hypothetical protein